MRGSHGDDVDEVFQPAQVASVAGVQAGYVCVSGGRDEQVLHAPSWLAARERPDAPPAAVVLRLRGHLRTNLTSTKALQTYAERVEESGGTLVVCGLQPGAITQLRSAGLPEGVTLLAQGEELEGSLVQAYRLATNWLAQQGHRPT
jgi:hypothetical protein